ncbi:MAG: hypothetical protein CVV51_05110 [Spirochaetae bacterium HGW-Spirochaetae-7]|nr:MAG: hypothetical protein CVV51_05110 [Spirochaetae bacterium HGW-Spirochaetae-7]
MYAGVRVDLDDGYRRAEQVLDLLEEALLLGVAESYREARGAGSRCAPDAVDVGLRFGRQVEIEHVRNVVNVDAPCREVGGDEYRRLACAESLHRPGTVALALVGVNDA